MKHLLSIFLLTVVYSTASAQIAFGTGSVDFDADLNIINTNANSNITAFKTDMNVSFGVSIPTIDNMISISMAPAEIYLALEIAASVNKPVADVIVCYKKNKGKGWGVIAQEMGIKPGSDAFHNLKGKCNNKKDKGNGKGNGNGKNK